MIWLEVFGYIGTALVLLSMMMTSVARLRIVNMAGSVVSAIYAALCNTWPVVLLNVGLIIINAIQLTRLYKLRSLLIAVETDTEDPNVDYFIRHYLKDIKLYFPDFEPDEQKGKKAFVVYDGTEAIGILVGQRNGEEIEVVLDYVSKKYRDRSVAKFLFNHLGKYGIKSIVASPSTPKHNKYLIAMDFMTVGDKMVKKL